MSEPVIAGKSPKMMSLAPGTYYWCACGLSKNQPYCDGSHAGTDFAPVEFAVGEEKEAALCMCKRTKTPPYCDGTHTNL